MIGCFWSQKHSTCCGLICCGGRNPTKLRSTDTSKALFHSIEEICVSSNRPSLVIVNTCWHYERSNETRHVHLLSYTIEKLFSYTIEKVTIAKKLVPVFILSLSLFIVLCMGMDVDGKEVSLNVSSTYSDLRAMYAHLFYMQVNHRDVRSKSRCWLLYSHAFFNILINLKSDSSMSDSFLYIVAKTAVLCACVPVWMYIYIHSLFYILTSLSVTRAAVILHTLLPIYVYQLNTLHIH